MAQALASLGTWLASLRERHWAFWALTFANALGIGFGYYYYWQVGQFDPSSQYYQPKYLWAFVSDSPNAVLLMQISLSLWYFGRKRYAWLDSLAFVHMVYVGLWTTYLFLHRPDQLGTWDWGGTNNILFFSHMGMPLEAFIVAKPVFEDMQRWWLGGALLAWGALNLYLDYGPMDLRPAPFIDVGPTFSTGAAILGGVTMLAWLAVAQPWRRTDQSP